MQSSAADQCHGSCCDGIAPRRTWVNRSPVPGLPHVAISVHWLDSGAIACLAFDVRFGTKADILDARCHFRFCPKADIQTGLAGFTSKLNRRISIVCCLVPYAGSTGSSARIASLAVRAFLYASAHLSPLGDEGLRVQIQSERVPAMYQMWGLVP